MHNASDDRHEADVSLPEANSRRGDRVVGIRKTLQCIVHAASRFSPKARVPVAFLAICSAYVLVGFCLARLGYFGPSVGVFVLASVFAILALFPSSRQ